MSTVPSTPQKESTAQALVQAAIVIIGKKGFDAASTREIAAAAQTNVASIAYHFGGKEGLRAACAEHFAQTLSAMLSAVNPHEATSAEEAARLLEAAIDAMTHTLIGAESMRAMATFVLREMTDDGPGADLLYNAFALPAHQRLCRLCGLALGQPPESDAVKLLVFSLIGQLVYFRIGGPIVKRRMGWPAIGPEEAQAIAQMLRQNLRALLSTRRESP